MFSYSINYRRHLTLKQQKNLHKGLFIQLKGRSEDKSLYRFSHLVNVTCFCIMWKKIFSVLYRSIMRNYISFCKKKTFTVTLSISVDHLCYF